MYYMKNLLPVVVLSLLIGACTKDAKTKLNPLDLLSYGVPITIMAPDSAKVETMDMIVQKDITVRKGKDYYVQIYASDATTRDVAQLKAEQLAEVKTNRFFSKIINEEEAGFIYEMAIDSVNINYGFRHVRVQGDREYVFQTGLVGNFNLEETQRMYEAVKPVE